KVRGTVVLEPALQLPLRAETEGFVAEVADNRGGSVPAGAGVVWLRNIPLVAKRQQAQAEVERRSGEASSALASGDMATYQTALRERQRAEKELAELRRQESKLEIHAPFLGAVLTPRLQDLIGKHVAPGDLLCDFGDLRKMRARIQVSEFDFADLAGGQPGVKVQLSAYPGDTFSGRVVDRSKTAGDGYDATGRPTGLVRTVAASPTEPPPTAPGKAKREGAPFSHFDIIVEIPNADARLFPGMSGTAKIYPNRRSFAVRIYESIRDLI